MAGFLFLFWACPKGQAIRYKSSLRSGLSAAVLHALSKEHLKPRQNQSTHQAICNNLHSNTKLIVPSRCFTKKYYLGTENLALLTLKIDAIVRLIYYV